MRRLALIGIAMFSIFISLGFAVRAQNQEMGGTPEAACATPMPGMEGTPMVVMAASPGATPAACPSPSPEGGAAGGGEAQTNPTIEMVDIAFNPNMATIPANTDVTITLPNSGVTVHNFNIDSNQNPSDPGIHSGDIQPGSSGSVTVNLPPGTWYFYCNIPGHEAAGMHGTITVQ